MAFTPPVSPSDSHIMEDSDPYFPHGHSLECNGDQKNSNFYYKGLLRSGEAALISKPVVFHSARNSSTYKVFGVLYEADSHSSSDLERLFCLARKTLCILAAAPKSFGAPRPFKNAQTSLSEALSGDDCADFRKELKDFYLMLRYFLASQDKEIHWVLDEMSDIIKDGLSLLRLELGWLADLPRFLQQYASASKSASYHVFHAHLELRWFHISVLHYLLSFSNDNQIDFSQSFFKRPDALSSESVETLKEAVLTTVVDLTSMAVMRFNWTRCEELVSNSMFNCNCVKEIWLLLIIFVDKTNSGNDNKHPFWSLMDDVNELVVSSEDVPKKTCRTDLRVPKKVKCENPSLFSLWWLSNLTELFLYDDRGNLRKNKLDGSECNYLALKRALTQLTEESHQRTEEERRVVVHLVRSILDVYSDPKPDAIMILWDFFFRSLDCPFQLPGARAGNFAVLSDTPSGLLGSVVKLLEQQPSIKSNTSYDAFLHLVGNHLGKHPLHWKQKMRGRVFSKLSARKVSSLNEWGLFHLVQFFFTVAIKTDLEDVAFKLNELLSSVDETTDAKRKSFSALARLALVQIMAEKGIPFGKVLEPLLSDVAFLVSRGQFKIPRLFVDAIEEIVRSNDSLELDQHLLVGDWINQYLHHLNHENHHEVLHALVTITKKLRSVLNYGSTGPGQDKLCDALRTHVMPFVKQQMASTGLEPFLVADLAAHLTFLSVEQRSTSVGVVSESFNQLVRKFVDNDGSNVTLVRRYLWLILTEESLITNVRERFSNQEHLLITQAWIRINLFCSNTNNEEIRELTYHIFRLPVISHLFKLSWAELEQLANAEDPFISVIEYLGRAVDEGKDLVEFRRGLAVLFQLIDQWLKNIKLHVSSLKPKDGSRPPPWNPPSEIMGQPAKESFLRLYLCMGTLLLKCPRLVFEKNTGDCLLVKTVSSLLVHRSLHNFETELSVPLDHAVRSYLHFFVIGLYRLDPQKEPCIRRYFKDIVKMYVPRMISMGGTLGGAAQRNPFVQMWGSDEHDAESAGALVMQIVAELFINADHPSSAPTLSQHAKAVKFVDILLRDFPANENLFRAVITYIVPEALEMSTKSSDFLDTYKILPSVLNAPFYAARPALWCVMDSAIQQLSSKHLSLNPQLFFKILTKLSKDFRHLVKRFLPFLKKNIEEVCRKRGVGNDKKLQSYYDLLAKAIE